MRKRRRGRMKRPNEGAAVEIFDFGYRKRRGHPSRISAQEISIKYRLSVFYIIVLMGRVAEDVDPYNQGIRHRRFVYQISIARFFRQNGMFIL